MKTSKSILKQLYKENQIGKTIRFERKRQGITPEELAEATGVSSRQIYQIEEGNSARVGLVKWILEILDLSPERLIKATRTRRHMDQEYLSKWSGVSKRQISRVENGYGTTQKTLDQIAEVVGLEGIFKLERKPLTLNNLKTQILYR